MFFFGGFDLLFSIIIGSFRYAHKGNFFATLIGATAWPIFIDAKVAKRDGWSRKRIFGILGRHGIKCWGWGHGVMVDEYYFRVPLERGAHATAILRKVGAPVVGNEIPKTSRKRVRK